MSGREQRTTPHWRTYAKTITRPLVILEGVDI
jgi:hypothetical protein